jgi:hypothetical protein
MNKEKMKYFFENFAGSVFILRVILMIIILSITLPTNKWVGEQLGITESSVLSFLNRIKVKMAKSSEED